MDTVGSQIERQRASLVGLLENLVRTPSPNPPGDTRAVADLIAARLREAAVDFQVLADEPRKPNIIARIGQGRPELLFTSHMDTAPAGIAVHGATTRSPLTLWGRAGSAGALPTPRP